MNIQSAISECDKTQAILIALLSYENSTSTTPDQSVIQGLLYAAESNLEQASHIIQTRLSNCNDSNTSTPEPTTAENIDLPHTSTIGDRIRELRVLREMSVDDLAIAVNLPTLNIISWEANIIAPVSDSIIPLANALKCDPLWLLAGTPADIAEES